MGRLLASCALLVLCTSTLYAQSDDRAAQAKLHYETGMAHFQLEEYDKAILEWEAGFRTKPVPQFLYNIAQAYRLSKQYEKAASFYKKYLNMDPKAPNKPEVDRHLATLNKLVEQQKAASTAPPTQPIVADTGKPQPKIIEPAKPKPTVAAVKPPPEPVRPVAPPPEPPRPSPSPDGARKGEPVKPAPVEPAPVAQPVHNDVAVTAAPVKDDRPITKKPWFWGVIGGVGALVVAGVVVGVVVGTQDNTPVLAPARF